MAGVLINTRGTTIMIDPVLRDFDMPILIDMPIMAEVVPRLDAVLVTHSDNDHYSVPTCRELGAVTSAFHSTITTPRSAVPTIGPLLQAVSCPPRGAPLVDLDFRRPSTDE